MENEVFLSDLSSLAKQLRYEIQKNLKFWVDEQVKKFIKPPARVTVVYEKVRKTKWADMTIKKNNLYIIRLFYGENLERIMNVDDAREANNMIEMFKDSVLHEISHITTYIKYGNNLYTIRLYYGENLERITNVDSAREANNMIEMFKDSVLHEISHITTYIKYGPGHKHDRIWKQEAVMVGTIPRRATSPVRNKLVRSGERNFKILCKGSVDDSIEFWRSVQKDYRGYFTFDKKTNKPLYFFQKRSSYRLFTNAIVECSKCKRKWFVNWNGITNYYCCYDGAKCEFKTLNKVIESLK